jgi:hypothetical protein
MELIEIKETECPTCSARPNAETQDNMHCNGHFNETRTFTCGLRLNFSPNFMRTRVTLDCPNTEASKSREAARVEAKLNLEACIFSLLVDEEYRSRLKSAIAYI